MGSNATQQPLPHPVNGDWGSEFVFKMYTPADLPRVLEHLRKSFYSRALSRLGYTSDMDPEMDAVFSKILNDGNNLSFFVEHKPTGKIAGCRVITMEKKGVDPKLNNPFESRICRGFFLTYYTLLDECNLYERYGLKEIPHMFGISVDPEFCQRGLAIEIYKRAKALCLSRGFKVVTVAFISPYSRAAAAHHDFIQLVKAPLLEAKDEFGGILHPEAPKDEFMDFGVFILDNKAI